MKQLSNIRYILFAIILLGLFANFAQNEYGLLVVTYGTLLLALNSLINVIVLERIIWKQKKSGVLFVGISLILICFLLMIIIGGIDVNGDIIVVLGLFFLGALLIETIIVLIGNWNKTTPSNRFLAMESFGLFFLLIGVTMKNMHWKGASLTMIFGGLIFLLIYLPKSFKLLVSEFKNGGLMAVFNFLFYINIVCGVLFFIFKNNHWTGSFMLCSIAFVFLLILLIPLILNLKFKYHSEKISIVKYLKQKNSMLVFIFVFVNYFAFFIFIQAASFGPKIYTLERPPALQKMMDKSTLDDDPKVNTYRQNYQNFLDNRWEAQKAK